MAIDKSLIARDIALNAVTHVNNLIKALNGLKELQEWRNGATVSDFTAYESGNGTNPEILGENSQYDDLKHLDGAKMNKLLGKVCDDESETGSILHHLDNTKISGGPYNDKKYLEMLLMVKNVA